MFNIVKKHIYALFFTVAIVAGCKSGNQNIKPQELTCEYLSNPLGIDVLKPRLSWMFTSAKRGDTQTAYHVLVASSMQILNDNKGDLWDSQKVITDSSFNVVYKGAPLKSGLRCYWKVKIWDKDGNESTWSDAAHWSIGLLNPTDWKGEWIGNDKPMPGDTAFATYTRIPARYLRKEFNIEKGVKQATAYLCGLGLSELYLNGQKVGNAVLSPALAEYPTRAWYVTYDVTAQIKTGKNAVGAILGNGRFTGMRRKEIPVYYDTTKLTHYGMPKMTAVIDVEHTDGTHSLVTTDTTWTMTNKGPIIANNEFDGEEYNANLEMHGWNEPGFEGTGWIQARKVKAGAKTLSAQMMPPIRVINSIKPKRVFKHKPGVYIFDMGQNMVGWTQLKVKGKKGQKITMRFAEVLTPDSTLYMEPLRTAKVTDEYTLKGDTTEYWEPRFTYHGFRYVEVSGYPGQPGLDAITGRVVHDDLVQTGEFATSNNTINQIFHNARWGMKGNYRSIPTDCPQRDERQGWLGDRATGSRGESYVFKNQPLYAKWLQDIEDTQLSSGSLPDVAPSYWKVRSDNVTWPAAYIIIANMLYDQFGDDRVIRKHYPSMKKWMQFMRDNYMKDNIIEHDTYGDWCVPAEDSYTIISRDPKRQTKGAVLSTGYYYYLTGIMERFAELTGNTADSAMYASSKPKIKTAFNTRFLSQSGKAYSNNTATANAMALFFGLAPDSARDEIFNNMLDVTRRDFNNHVSTGLIGVQFLMRTLTDMGRPDIAYKLTTNKDYPGWGYMVENGATTIWELWNGNTADAFMNSHNHLMLLGDLIIWYFEDLAGIKPAAPAFKQIMMYPKPAGNLSFVKSSFKSPYGIIKSHWQIKNGSFYWKVSIPANTTAMVYIPAGTENDIYEGDTPLINAQGVKLLKAASGRIVCQVGSGDYSFRASNFKRAAKAK